MLRYLIRIHSILFHHVITISIPYPLPLPLTCSLPYHSIISIIIVSLSSTISLHMITSDRCCISYCMIDLIYYIHLYAYKATPSLLHMFICCSLLWLLFSLSIVFIQLTTMLLYIERFSDRHPIQRTIIYMLQDDFYLDRRRLHHHVSWLRATITLLVIICTCLILDQRHMVQATRMQHIRMIAETDIRCVLIMNCDL